MISRAEFDAYNKAVEQIGAKAASDVERSIIKWCAANPSASVAEKREAAKLIMDGFMQGYDEIASSFAAEWYDFRAARSGFKLKQAVTMAVYSPGETDKVARYQARKLAKEGDEAFAKSCGEYARNDVFRSLNETIIENAARDKKKGVRFARVTTGNDTGLFCLMLASRGAVYKTRKTAGEFMSFHRGCDCKVVPGFEKDPLAVLVEGHNPNVDYLRWKKLEQIDSMEDLSKMDRDVLKSRVMVLDVALLGRKTIGHVEYAKPRAALEEHEKTGVDFLVLNGYNVRTIPEDPKAPANLDLSIDGTLWEMKNLTNSKSSVSNQVKRARIKWFKLDIESPMTSIFTNEGNSDGFEKTCDELEARRRAGEVFIAISDSGVVQILKDK